MLELLGDGYIFQHIYNERYKELIDTSYKVYLTDGIKAIAGLKNRWYPRIENIEKPQEPEPDLNEMIKMIHAVGGEQDKPI